MRTLLTVGSPGGNTPGLRNGTGPAPPPEAGTQPRCGRKRRSFRRSPGVRRPEQRRVCGRHTRIDRAAELPEEVDVERAVGELRVQPADHIAARARELEVDTRPWRGHHGRHNDPGAGDSHAHLKPSALVRRSGGRCAHSGCCGQDPGHEDEPLHGTLRNHSADSAPPKSRKAAEPPANRSVISRDSRRCPSREPSFS